MYVQNIMIDTLEECAALCQAMPGCSGVEHGDCGRCEVWLEQVTGAAPADGFVCLRKPPAGATEGIAASAPRPAKTNRPLGEYGFLTEFNISTDEARDRVRKMVRLFGVLEFQLYDTMYSYSGPPTDDEDEWTTPCGGKLVKRSVLEAYTNEISALGGRSWLYVQAMGTDPNDQAAQEGFHVEGTHNCGDVPLLDTIFPSAEWAQRIAPKWMTFASKMGFGGIHWDTLGPGGDVPAFLRAARPLVESEGLEQTCNFVGGQAWDDSLVNENIVTFPYWEVWTVPDTLNRFWESAKNWNGGVLACYPGETVEHEREMNNRLYGGVPPLDLLIDRWAIARNLSMAYLAIGDGVRRVGMEFLPAAIPMPEEEIAKIQKALFRIGEVQFLGAHTTAGSVEALTKGVPTAAPVHVQVVAQG